MSLAQRACLIVAPAWAGGPGFPPAPEDGQQVVFDVRLLEIVSWSRPGEEVWRMKVAGEPPCCSYVSTFMRTPSGKCSLAALFPRDPEEGGRLPEL